MEYQHATTDSDPPDDLVLARELRDTFIQQPPALASLLAALKGDPVPLPPSPARLKSAWAPPTSASEPDEDLRFVLATVVAYCNGATQQQIATTHGLHVQTIRAILREAGVKVNEHNSTFTEDKLQVIRRLHADGVSARELGRRYRVAHTTILRHLR